MKCNGITVRGIVTRPN